MKNIIVCFAAASAFWFLMFSPWTSNLFNFWYLMIFATTTLIGLSVLFYKENLKKLLKFEWKWLYIGIFSALILYCVFFVGNLLANWIFSFANHEIQSIYSTKEQSSKIFIGLALFFLIGPAEEIFWRGYAQNFLANKIGENKGFLITTLIYSFVHIWAFNFMLLVAAMICGLFWGWMFKKYKSLWPVIISHSLWDTLIFVVIPIN